MNVRRSVPPSNGWSAPKPETGIKPPELLHTRDHGLQVRHPLSFGRDGSARG